MQWCFSLELFTGSVSWSQTSTDQLRTRLLKSVCHQHSTSWPTLRKIESISCVRTESKDLRSEFSCWTLQSTNADESKKVQRCYSYRPNYYNIWWENVFSDSVVTFFDTGGSLHCSVVPSWPPSTIWKRDFFWYPDGRIRPYSVST